MPKKKQQMRVAARKALIPLREACKELIDQAAELDTDTYSQPVKKVVTPAGATVLERLHDGGIEVSAEYTRTGAGGIAVGQVVDITFPVGDQDIADTNIYAEAVDGSGIRQGPQGLRRYPELARAVLAKVN